MELRIFDRPKTTQMRAREKKQKLLVSTFYIIWSRLINRASVASFILGDVLVADCGYSSRFVLIMMLKADYD